MPRRAITYSDSFSQELFAINSEKSSVRCAPAHSSPGGRVADYITCQVYRLRPRLPSMSRDRAIGPSAMPCRYRSFRCPQHGRSAHRSRRQTAIGPTQRRLAHRDAISGAGLPGGFARRRWVPFSAPGRCAARGSVQASCRAENYVNVAARPEYIPQQQCQCAPRDQDGQAERADCHERQQHECDQAN
jgi:hypothetical protein